MKNALLASTALMLTAGIAAADVKLSGYGRFGLSYQENDAAAALLGTDETTLSYRLRLNIDVSTEADNGVAFGGRVRLQQSNGQTQAVLSPALLYVTFEGLRVEVGNANTAYDSVALMYNPEVGFQSRSFGDPSGTYYAFNTGPFATVNRVGVMVSYAMGGLNARLSYVDPDQTVADVNAVNGLVDENTEVGISFDYTSGPLTVAVAYVQDGGGILGNDQTFAGVGYAIDADTMVGLNYIDNGVYADGGAGVDNGTTFVLYGSRNFGPISAIAYVSNNDAPGNSAPGFTETAYGIGAGYDLGGAVLSAGLERGYNELVRGDIGVKFNF